MLAASTDSATSGICDQAAQIASQHVGVPLDVLRAITRTETGRRAEGQVRPWPWTVNMEGAGHWFRTQDAARHFVFSHFKTGARSFDVGCFQINYKWHNKAFRSIDDMFNPEKNAIYAAQYLQELFSEFGDWTKAVGAYHSRTATYAERYLKRYHAILASLPDARGGGGSTTRQRLGIAQNGPFIALTPRSPATTNTRQRGASHLGSAAASRGVFLFPKGG